MHTHTHIQPVIPPPVHTHNHMHSGALIHSHPHFHVGFPSQSCPFFSWTWGLHEIQTGMATASGQRRTAVGGERGLSKKPHIPPAVWFLPHQPVKEPLSRSPVTSMLLIPIDPCQQPLSLACLQPPTADHALPVDPPFYNSPPFSSHFSGHSSLGFCPQLIFLFLCTLTGHFYNHHPYSDEL